MFYVHAHSYSYFFLAAVIQCYQNKIKNKRCRGEDVLRAFFKRNPFALFLIILGDKYLLHF